MKVFKDIAKGVLHFTVSLRQPFFYTNLLFSTLLCCATGDGKLLICNIKSFNDSKKKRYYSAGLFNASNHFVAC